MEKLSTFSNRLIKLREFFKMNKNEFANVIEVTPTNLGRYEIDTKPGLDFFERLLAASSSLGGKINLNWLVGGQGSMMQNQKNNMLEEIPDTTSQLLIQSISIAKEKENFTEFDRMLEHYIVREAFKKKFTFSQSTSFFSSMYWHFQKLKILRLFARAIKEQKKLQKSIEPEKSKKILQEAVKNYKFKFEDKFDNLIFEKQRKYVLDVVNQFDDLECFAILADIDTAIEILEDEKLTTMNKFHIPLLSSPVKL